MIKLKMKSSKMSSRVGLTLLLLAWLLLVNWFLYSHYHHGESAPASSEGEEDKDIVVLPPPLPGLGLFKSYTLDLMLQARQMSARKQNLRKSIDTSSSSPPRKTTFALTIWTSDFHISPVADLKNLLSSYNVKFIDKSLSGHCHLMNTCQEDLRVINKENGIDLGHCPNRLRRAFYDYYKQDQEFMSSDIILCTHAASMCELFMPFNKTLIVISSTRYEIGRHSQKRWMQWNENLRRISRLPGNVVAANNAYDQHYMRHFTGIGGIKILPSYCGYIIDRYISPASTKDVLIGPSRGVSNILLQQLESAELEFFQARTDSGSFIRKFKLSPIRSLYPVHHEYSDIVTHPAIIFLPYQVSLMSFFEFYRMNIPLYVPSLRLLTDWHVKYNVLNERTWDSVYGHPSTSSAIPRDPIIGSELDYLDVGSSGGGQERIRNMITSDPNDEYNRNSIFEWLSLSDYYQWPYVRLFDSWEELFTILATDNFHEISENMKSFNAFSEDYVRNEWLTMLNNIDRLKPMMSRVDRNSNSNNHNNNNNQALLSSDINESLNKFYNTQLDDTCINHEL